MIARPCGFHRRAQPRSQTCNWVEQFCWHWPGLVVVPTTVTDGMTVVPLMVLMQVLSHESCWLLQPLRQVAELDEELCAVGDVVVSVVGVPAVGDAVFSGAAGAFVSCADAGTERPSASTAATTATWIVRRQA